MIPAAIPQAGPEVRRLLLLKRMATLCALLILAITSISAFIRLSNVGLGCADWPQCYGQNLRQAQQGGIAKASESAATVGARMVHRVVAVAVLLLIIVMAMACFSAKPVLWRAGWMTLALLALALFLAVLGRWSSGARVPAVAIGNLLGGFAMLALCWRLRQEVSGQAETGVAAKPATANDTAKPSAFARMRAWAWLGAIVLFCQVALGGLVSAGLASLSCTGLPDCGGSEGAEGFSNITNITLASLDPWREPVFAATAKPPANPAGAASHMAHRYGTLVALLVLVPLGLAALRGGRPRTGWLVLLLLVVQIELGLLMVALSLPLWGALAHNLIGALLLAVVLSLV